MPLKTTTEPVSIGDLIEVSACSYRNRAHCEGSPTQNKTTMERSNKGLFWFYTNSPNKSDLRNLSAIIVDSYFIADGRELFVCLFLSGELKPFEAHELTLIQKRNGELPL